MRLIGDFIMLVAFLFVSAFVAKQLHLYALAPKVNRQIPPTGTASKRGQSTAAGDMAPEPLRLAQAGLPRSVVPVIVLPNFGGNGNGW